MTHITRTLLFPVILMAMISCSEDNSKHIESNSNVSDTKKQKQDLSESYYDVTIIIEIIHIGVSDKPVPTIIFTNKDVTDIEGSNTHALIHKFKLSEKGILRILNIFLMGAYYSSVYDNSFEYGSFEFNVTKQSVAHDFKTNRRDSISIFNELYIVLENNSQAKSVIGNILKRLNF